MITPSCNDGCSASIRMWPALRIEGNVMPNRLEKSLEPGERVVHRPSASSTTVVRVSLALGLFLSLFATGSAWIVYFLKGTIEPHPLIFGAWFGVMGLALPVIHARGGSLAILTDRRLLTRASPLARQVTKVALGDIQQVHGLASEGRLPVQMVKKDGGIVSFNKALWELDLGLAIARATGLPGADRRETRAETIAGLLCRADSWGTMVGPAVLSMATLGLLGVMKTVLTGLSLPMTLGIFIMAMMLMALSGIVVGRICGTVLVFVRLRRSASDDDLSDALDLLAQRRLLPREKDEFGCLQPLIWRIARFASARRSSVKTVG